MRARGGEAVGTSRFVAAGTALQAVACVAFGDTSHWPLLLLVFLLGAGLAIGTSRALLRRAGQPLELLSRRLSVVAASPLGASPVPDMGSQGPLEAAVSDLHRRVTGSLDKTRKSREAAQEAGVYKTAFLKAVSHELRTPLNAILGFTHVLLSGLEGEVSPSRRENLEVIRDAGQRLLEIFNDSIELSTMASGQLSLRRERVGVARLLADVVTALEQQRGDRPIHIHSVVPDQPLRLSVQRDRLLTALRALGEHALQRTESGAVRLTAELSKGTGSTPDMVTLSIEDGGPAESQAALAALFRPDLASDVNTRRRCLRLAISKQLIELHDGYLELIEGIEGKTFAVHLPAAVAGSGDAQGESDAGPSAPADRDATPGSGALRAS